MILYITIASILGLFIFGIFLFVFIARQKQKLGMPKGKIISVDSQQMPAELLFAKSIPLFGKPDYIIRQKNLFIPVEKKTGKTPEVPYKNHIAQVLAYCFLIEEHFGIRPSHGVIRYPEESFSVAYEKRAEINIKNLVLEILSKKGKSHTILATTKVCRECREKEECKRRRIAPKNIW